MENSDSTLTERDFGDFVQTSTSFTMGRAFWPLLAFVVVSGIQIICDGISSDYLWLGAGALLAGVTMFFYGVIAVVRARGEPNQPWMLVAATAGFAPYLYSLYVIGYWGIWSLREIGAPSFVWPTVKGGFFILLGYRFLRSYYHLTEIRRNGEGVMRTGDKSRNGDKA